MKLVNLNKYVLYSYYTIGLIAFFMHSYEYESDVELILIYTMSGLLFLPFEIFCSKVMYYIWKKETFQTRYFWSNRVVTVQ